MKRLIVSPDTVFLEYMRRLLDERGIKVFIRNPTNSGLAAGELPPAVAQPEMWVGEEDFSAAEHLLQKTEQAFETRAGEPWKCPNCGEKLEAQFEVCWRCGTEQIEK